MALHHIYTLYMSSIHMCDFVYRQTVHVVSVLLAPVPSKEEVKRSLIMDPQPGAVPEPLPTTKTCYQRHPGLCRGNDLGYYEDIMHAHDSLTKLLSGYGRKSLNGSFFVLKAIYTGEEESSNVEIRSFYMLADVRYAAPPVLMLMKYSELQADEELCTFTLKIRGRELSELRKHSESSYRSLRLLLGEYYRAVEIYPPPKPRITIQQLQVTDLHFVLSCLILSNCNRLVHRLG